MKKLTELNKRTNKKYLAYFQDMYVQESFDHQEMTRKHNVSAILPAILLDFGYINRVGKRQYKWVKAEEVPTIKFANKIRIEAIKRWKNSNHAAKIKESQGALAKSLPDQVVFNDPKRIVGVPVIDNHDIPEHSLKFPEWNISPETDKQIAAKLQDYVIVDELKKRGYKMTEL